MEEYSPMEAGAGGQGAGGSGAQEVNHTGAQLSTCTCSEGQDQEGRRRFEGQGREESHGERDNQGRKDSEEGSG